MSTVQLESLWQFIQSLGLSRKNRQWLADKLVEPTSGELENAKAETLAAIKDAKEKRNVTVCATFEDYLKAVAE